MHVHAPDRLLRGALLLTLSGLLFSLMGVLIRLASTEVNNETVVFMRNLVGCLLFLPWVLRRGLAPFATRVPHLHLVRALVGLGAMYCFFYAIAHIPLAEAMLFTYAAPVFVPLVSRAWLGEPLSARVYLAIVIGLAGVILVLKPGPGIFRAISLVGLAACFLAAVAFTAVRRLSVSEPPLRIVFYFTLISTLVSALPMAWAWQGLSAQALVLLVGVGVLATVSQLVMSEAYRVAPVGTISPFSYTAIVFSAALAWLIWSEPLDRYALGGALLIFASGVLTLRPRAAPANAKTDRIV